MQYDNRTTLTSLKSKTYLMESTHRIRQVVTTIRKLFPNLCQASLRQPRSRLGLPEAVHAALAIHGWEQRAASTYKSARASKPFPTLPQLYPPCGELAGSGVALHKPRPGIELLSREHQSGETTHPRKVRGRKTKAFGFLCSVAATGQFTQTQTVSSRQLHTQRCSYQSEQEGKRLASASTVLLMGQ